MSSNQVEIIRRSYRAFRDNDRQALLALYHPDAVWDMTSWKDFPEVDVYRGLAGIEKVLRLLRASSGK
jgi:ketosteroid isomerase-like protein